MPHDPLLPFKCSAALSCYSNAQQSLQHNPNFENSTQEVISIGALGFLKGKGTRRCIDGVIRRVHRCVCPSTLLERRVDVCVRQLLKWEAQDGGNAR